MNVARIGTGVLEVADSKFNFGKTKWRAAIIILCDPKKLNNNSSETERSKSVSSIHKKIIRAN